MSTKKLNHYRFDVGDSTTGPVGFVAVIAAETQEDAVTRLHAVMPEEWELPFVAGDTKRMGEYMCVYLNPRLVSECDIDEEMGP